MQSSSFVKSVLALQAWRDGFDSGLSGMLAVSFVYKARVDAGWFGGDWIQTLSHSREVSYRLDPYPDELPDPRMYAFQLLLQEIDDVFIGSRKNDITIAKESVLAIQPPAPLYFARLDRITNPWFEQNISLNNIEHKRIAQVGDLFFWT